MCAVTAQRRCIDALLLAGLAVLVGAPALWNLGTPHLWQDEAQTALLSRTVLDYGVPKGFDGRNYYSQELGAEYGTGHTWRWHTWLPFYVLAAFFAVFGEGTWIARLPFALFGIATVLATYILAQTMWRDRRAAVASAASLALCIPFLILIRQCRWYSPAALFTVLSLLGYWRMAHATPRGALLFVLATVALFHTHYVYVAAVLPAVLTHAAVWHRDRMKSVVIASGITVALCAPWVAWLLGMRYTQQYGHTFMSVSSAWVQLGAYVGKLEEHILPIIVLEVPVVLLAFHVLRGDTQKCVDETLWRGLSCLLLVSSLALLVLALAGPAPFFRYLCPFLPIASMILGRIVAALMNLHWSMGLAAIGFVVLRGPVSEYVHELTHNFDGPVEGIVSHLREHAEKEDVVATTYGDMPIKFYTNLRVVGGLTGEDLAQAVQPEWIIIRRHNVGGNKEWPVRKFLAEQLQRGEYERIILDYPDTPFENSEEPSAHLFRTAADMERVVIWRKTARSASSVHNE